MTLPLEIFLHVFAILQAMGAYSTLGTCARLCSPLRYICQRLIFSHIDFNFDRGTGYDLAPRIVKILSSNTRLADFVDSVAIRVVIGIQRPLDAVYDLFDCLTNCQVTTLLLSIYDVMWTMGIRIISGDFEFKVHRFIASLRPTLRTLQASNLPFSAHKLPIESLEELVFVCERSQRPELSFVDTRPQDNMSDLAPLRIGKLTLPFGGPLDIIPDPTRVNTKYFHDPGSRIDFQSIHTLSVFLSKDVEVDPALLLAKTSNLTDLYLTVQEPPGVEGALSQLHPNAFKTVKRLELYAKFLDEPHPDLFFGLFQVLPRFTALESLVIKTTTYPGCWPFRREVWEQPVTVLDPVAFPYLKKVEITVRAFDRDGDGGLWLKRLRASSFERLREFVPEVDCRVVFWGLESGEIPDVYTIH